MTTPHDWFIEHRSAFVIRSLEPEEERSFNEHLTGCESCRTETARIERELAWLPMAVPPVTPRPGLARSLAEAALGTGSRVPRWAVPVSLAASLLLAVGAWGWASQSVRATRAELASVRDTLSIIRDAAKVRFASITMDNHQGGVVLFADERTHRWNVVVYGLPTPHAGEVCQFWFITDQGMIRGVQVKSEPSLPAFLTLSMPNDTSHFVGAALSLEPAGSSGQAPEGPLLAHLIL